MLYTFANVEIIRLQCTTTALILALLDAESERTVKTSGEHEAIHVDYRASRV